LRRTYWNRPWRQLTAALVSIALLTWIYASWLHVTNTTTVALTFLLVVLVTAATSRLRVAVITSIAAMLCFNFFFLPPLGTLTISDPQNWIALVVFLAVSLVASNLSAAARDREALALERLQLLEEKKSAEVARKSEEMKSALLASLAHDLRTPLTAIRVAATNLQASWLTDADRREQSEVVLTEVAHLTRLFQNILDMARIDAGAVELTKQWVHPLEVIEAARDHAKHALREHPIDIQGGDDVLVRLDPRLTAAALSQLLENAAQYSPEQSRIDVTAISTGTELLIHVHDRGPGIAKDELPRLFDRFYRGTTGGRRTGGTGMGLSIARGLLAVQGGRVQAGNAAEGGAIFTIAVPIETAGERKAAS
jgi:two-component system sensor histidine kinase KdpD